MIAAGTPNCTRLLDHRRHVARRHRDDDEVGNFRQLAKRSKAGLPLDAAMVWIDRIERAFEPARDQVAQKGQPKRARTADLLRRRRWNAAKTACRDDRWTWRSSRLARAARAPPNLTPCAGRLSVYSASTRVGGKMTSTSVPSLGWLEICKRAAIGFDERLRQRQAQGRCRRACARSRAAGTARARLPPPPRSCRCRCRERGTPLRHDRSARSRRSPARPHR